MDEWVVERTLVLACDGWGRAVVAQLEAHLAERHGGVALVQGLVIEAGGLCDLDGTPMEAETVVRALSCWEAAAALRARGFDPRASGEVIVWLVGGGPQEEGQVEAGAPVEAALATLQVAVSAVGPRWSSGASGASRMGRARRWSVAGSCWAECARMAFW